MSMFTIFDHSAEWIIGLIIFIGLAQNLLALVQLVVASLSMKATDLFDENEGLWQQRAPGALPITLIAPAYNESATIVESIESLLSLHYPYFEVIVVNDGSKDSTLQVLMEHFSLRPSSRAFDEVAPHKPINELYKSERFKNLYVIDKENGGKADSLNAGINVSRTPLFCAVDADSMLEKDSLLHATQPFRENPETVIAVGGTIRVANGCQVRNGKIVRVGLPKKLLPGIQTIEYIRAFLIARVAMSEMGVLTLISGAFGIFRRKAALMVGGYATDTVGEDYELILRMHRYHLEHNIPYEICSVPEPVCWTEVPERLKILASQRRRWQRGSLETFFRHRKMLMNPRYGRVGTLGMSFSLLIDVLGPISEVAGYLLVPLFWFTGILNVEYALAFLALTFAFGIFVSTGSLVLEEVSLHRIPKASDLMRLFFLVFIENLGYRQLANIWRIQGWVDYLRRKKGWGHMTRRGFLQS